MHPAHSRARLVLRDPPDTGTDGRTAQTFPLSADIPIGSQGLVVGRRSSSGLCIPGAWPTASGTHCTVTDDGTWVRIQDASSNGTFVQGRRLQKGALVRILHGHVIRIGSRVDAARELCYALEIDPSDGLGGSDDELEATQVAQQEADGGVGADMPPPPPVPPVHVAARKRDRDEGDGGGTRPDKRRRLAASEAGEVRQRQADAEMQDGGVQQQEQRRQADAAMQAAQRAARPPDYDDRTDSARRSWRKSFNRRWRLEQQQREQVAERRRQGRLGFVANLPAANAGSQAAKGAAKVAAVLAAQGPELQAVAASGDASRLKRFLGRLQSQIGSVRNGVVTREAVAARRQQRQRHRQRRQAEVAAQHDHAQQRKRKRGKARKERLRDRRARQAAARQKRRRGGGGGGRGRGRGRGAG